MQQIIVDIDTDGALKIDAKGFTAHLDTFLK